MKIGIDLGTTNSALAFIDPAEAGDRDFPPIHIFETPQLVARTISRYRRLLAGEISGAQLWQELKLLNQLGVTRGQVGARLRAQGG